MNEERLKMILHPSSDNNYSIIYAKNKIFKDLCKDSDIFELLNNTQLKEKEAVPEDYFYINIFPFLKIPETQSKVYNFICFEIDDLEDYVSNNVFMRRQIKFRVVSHKDDVRTPYGIPRQDLMAMLIDERMQWTEIFGSRLKKVYDAGKTSENGYYYRNMYYEQVTPNNLQYGLSENMLDYKGRRTYSIEDSFD